MSTTEPISRRDYFAANAPENIPKWFQPTLPNVISALPPEPPMPADLQAKIEADTRMKGLSAGGMPIAIQGEEDIAKFEQYKAKHDAWGRKVDQIKAADALELEKRRYFAWRWHYAEQMLNTRPPEQGDESLNAKLPAQGGLSGYSTMSPKGI